MNNIVLLPVLLPFIAGTLLILFRNYRRAQRVASAVVVLVLLLSSIYLLYTVYQGGILTVELGN